MDKQMIEEMAKVIADSCVIRKTYVNPHYPDRQKDMYYSLAEELLKYYQPKIPEGSVVLTRKRYNEHIKDAITFGKAIARKEISEKFAGMLKGKAVAREISEWKGMKYTTYHIVDGSFDEICKELTEGKDAKG